MTIRPWVQVFASKWERNTGYSVSPDMVTAVELVILASDPSKVETDNKEFIEVMTYRVLNAALVPENENKENSLFMETIKSLLEYYPILENDKCRLAIKKQIKFPDTENSQLDYENVRNQVEAILNGR